MLQIDEMLRYPGRCLRLQTGALLFGPTGERLFAETLTRCPGFCGTIDFIHKINLTRLFSFCCRGADGYQPDFEMAQTVWYPSHMTLTYEDEYLSLQECKFITWDDTAVSCTVWENRGVIPLTLILETGAEQCTDVVWQGHPAFESPVTSHGFRVGVAVAVPSQLQNGTLTLLPGQKISLTVAAAAILLDTQQPEQALSKAESWLGEEQAVFSRHQQQYQRFFADAPSFTCSDPMLSHAWMYRWFLLRHCMANPNYGNLRHLVEYEGRSHKMSKEPFVRKGWEFSKFIPLSTPLHLTELRWHGDHALGKEIIRSFFDTADENGVARWAYVDEYGTPYANYMVWAVYRFYLTDGDVEFVKQLLAAMKRFVQGHITLYGNDKDLLQIEYVHQRTGKEYQPSYWYFHRDAEGNYPADPKDKSTYTPLKRVDRSIYHLLNLRGLSYLCGICSDAQGEKTYGEMAQQLQQDIQQKMWDEKTGFFYDLHYQTDEKAMVKNIVGIYPYWAEVTGEDQLKGLGYLFDPQHFDTGAAFASVSKECPAYRAAGGWMGRFIKGRDGCVWCGPSWPYTTGIALDAIARQSKQNGHRFDGEFGKYLRQYCRQHFRDGDFTRPYLVEHYNAETGEPLSDDVDYNHSYFLELLIAHVCGIEVTQQGVSINPVDIGLRYFKLENVKIRGHLLSVTYSKDRSRPELGLRQGMRVLLDGQEVFSSENLTPAEVAL